MQLNIYLYIYISIFTYLFIFTMPMLIHTLTDVEVLIRVWSPFSETSAHIDLTEPGDAYVFILMAITNKARAPGLRSSHLPSQLREKVILTG